MALGSSSLQGKCSLSNWILVVLTGTLIGHTILRLLLTWLDGVGVRHCIGVGFLLCLWA